MPRKKNNQFSVAKFMKAKHQQHIVIAAEKAVLDRQIKKKQQNIRRLKRKVFIHADIHDNNMFTYFVRYCTALFCNTLIIQYFAAG